MMKQFRNVIRLELYIFFFEQSVVWLHHQTEVDGLQGITSPLVPCLVVTWSGLVLENATTLSLVPRVAPLPRAGTDIPLSASAPLVPICSPVRPVVALSKLLVVEPVVVDVLLCREGPRPPAMC